MKTLTIFIYLFIYLIRQMAANSKIHNQQFNTKHSKRKNTHNAQHKSQ